MALDAVFVDCILISFMSEQIVRMTVAHGEKRRRLVKGAERIGDGSGDCGGPLKLGLDLRRGSTRGFALKTKHNNEKACAHRHNRSSAERGGPAFRTGLYATASAGSSKRPAAGTAAKR